MSARRQPKAVANETAVYSGRWFAGTVIRRCDSVFDARDPTGRKVGLFKAKHAATGALLARAQLAMAL